MSLSFFPLKINQKCNPPKVNVNTINVPHNAPLIKMISIQNHKSSSAMSLSSQDLQEVRAMSRKLRQLKRQMFLKQVEAPSSVDSFRSLIMGLAVEQEAKEAFRSRSNSLSSEGTSSRSWSFDCYNDPFSSIRGIHRIEE